jgi:hypothetical protein
VQAVFPISIRELYLGAEKRSCEGAGISLAKQKNHFGAVSVLQQLKILADR